MDKKNYIQLFSSIIFIILLIYSSVYALQWYSETYGNKFDQTSNAIDLQFKESNINDTQALDSYKDMHNNADKINQLLFALFFLALIVFLIFWLVIMIRRSIIDR